MRCVSIQLAILVLDAHVRTGGANSAAVWRCMLLLHTLVGGARYGEHTVADTAIISNACQLIQCPLLVENVDVRSSCSLTARQ